MNKVFLQGRIGSEFTSIGSDRNPGVRFTLATEKPKYDSDGNLVKDANGYTEMYTQWHTIIAFNGKARSARVRKKGEVLTIVGEIRYSTNEKDGRTFYNTEIHAEEVHLG